MYHLATMHRVTEGHHDADPALRAVRSAKKEYL